jgi:8-oxo-dGTP pyrophosphatase MutT (NUDIX family)
VLTFDGPAGASVLLLRKTGRGRHAAQLCLPGGFYDEGRDGDDLRATAERELLEETGLAAAGRGTVELERWPVGVFRTQKTGIDVTAYPGSFDYFDVVYRAGVPRARTSLLCAQLQLGLRGAIPKQSLPRLR